jgi:hypothetical protein
MKDNIIVPDKQIALDFVEALTGSPDNSIRIRAKSDQFWEDFENAEHNSNCVEFAGTIDELWPQVVELQRQMYGIYYALHKTKPGPMSGVRGEFVTNKDIVGFRGIPCDFDTALPDEWHVQPQLVVKTSIRDGKQRGQAIWFTSDALTAETLEEAAKRLGFLYGGPDAGMDMTVYTPSHVFRLPGSLHLKGAPSLVTFDNNTWSEPLPLAGVLDGVVGLPPAERKVSKKPTSANADIGGTVEPGEYITAARLKAELCDIDPFVPHGEWLKIIAGIRSTIDTSISADDWDVKQALAESWSLGGLDDDGRFKGMPPRTSRLARIN